MKKLLALVAVAALALAIVPAISLAEPPSKDCHILDGCWTPD